MKLMTRMTKLRSLAAVMVFAAAVVGAQFTQVDSAHAAGGTATWTGAAGDNKFSTAGNWAENAVPQNGDQLILTQATAGTTGTTSLSATLDNDLAITFSGISTTAVTAPVTGMFYDFANSILLANNAVISVPSSNGVSFYFTNYATDGIMAAGNLTVDGSSIELYAPTTVNGTLTLKDNATVAPNIIGVTQYILDGGILRESGDATITTPIHVVSPSTISSAQGGGQDVAATITYSGAITLDADLTVDARDLKTVHFTGPVSGVGKIVTTPASTGTLVVDAYAVTPEPTVPGVPNTGVASIVKANPIIVMVAGIVAAVAVLVVAKRRQA